MAVARFCKFFDRCPTGRPFQLPSLASRSFTGQIESQDEDSFPDVPTSAYYDVQVNSAGESRDFTTMFHILEKRFADGCFTTKKTFNFIRSEEASTSVIDDLTQTLARLNKFYARKSAFDSLVIRLCKLDLIDEALRVTETMAAGGYGLSVNTFYPIFNALTRKNSLQDAWRVVDHMRNVGFSPDVTVYNHFLATLCFARDLPAASEILTKMVEEKIEADTRTYDALVLGACRAGKVENALALLRKMEDSGLPVLFSTHVYVMEEMLRVGYDDKAVEFIMCFVGNDQWMDTEKFGWLANRFIKHKKLDKAMFLLKEMEERRLAMGPKLKSFYENNSTASTVGVSHPVR